MSKRLIKQPDGSSFYGCECIEKVWPYVIEEAKRRGYIKINPDVFQGSYNQTVKASAKTHYYGGVLDVGYTINWQGFDDMLEEMGFASFQRGPKSFDGFTPHFHIIFIRCPHLHWQAANQVVSWKNHRDGLVGNRADRDQTRPAVYRTAAQSVNWVIANRNRVKAAVAVAQKKPVLAPPISFTVTLRGIKSGKPTGNVKLLQNQMNRSGWSRKVLGRDTKLDGIWGAECKKIFAAYQRSRGFSGAGADGIPGWSSFASMVQWRNTWTAVK